VNITALLEHWQITENPFRAEEARHDSVFQRLDPVAVTHPDFEKVVGDLHRPGAAIVFGEKGAGKTAIRLQLAERIRRHNALNPASRALLVGYDDWNPVLDRLLATVKPGKGDDARDLRKRLSSIRLVDHLDGALAAATCVVTDLMLFGDGAGGEPEAAKLRKAPANIRRDAQILQALYDRAEGYEGRAIDLRRRARVPGNPHRMLWKSLGLAGWLLPAAVAVAALMVPRQDIGARVWLYALAVAGTVWLALLVKWFLIDGWSLRRKARRVARTLRVVGRVPDALAATLGAIPPGDRDAASLPTDDSDEKRYAQFARLRRVLAALGYTSLILVVDRVDEPTSISGDVERMRAVVWPLLNNKFLQQDGVGVKLLLPVELRHELMRESAAFFQEARLDKQNFIERLTWTGASLYDLCNARLRACRAAGAPPIELTDLFDDDVNKQDVVDALDQMRQPRDAFKLLYQCMAEHASNITEGSPRTRIPRPVLESARKQQAERLQMLQRGYRPA
jgi:hypothetical protein